MFTVVLYALFVAVGRLVMEVFGGHYSHRTLHFCLPGTYRWHFFFHLYGASRVTPYVIAGAIKRYASFSSIYGAFVSISCKNQFAVTSGPAALWICLLCFLRSSS